MSEDKWQIWIERSAPLARVTPDALARALDGFRLDEPKPGWPWLARAIQGALLFTVPALQNLESPVTGECCVVTVPNATQARKIHQRIAGKASGLLAELISNSDLLSHNPLTPSTLCNLIGEVERAAEALAQAAQEAPRLPSRWRDARVRTDRIERATLLSPVYEAAYGKEPTLNAYPGSDGGPWPDFYQRIVALVFDDDRIDDRDFVLKKARKSDRLLRVTFGEGIIPEYPL